MKKLIFTTMRISWFFAVFGLLILLISSCANQKASVPVPVKQPTTSPAATVADYFPLSKGAYWIYEGDVKWQVGAAMFEKIIRWKMEVVDVVQRTDTIGFKMQGAPWDLAFYEDGKKPSEYSFIKVGSSRFYEGSIEDYERLLDKGDFLVDLVKDSRLFLDIPLSEGEKICDTSSITRNDPLYCWHVRGDTQIQLVSVKGVRANHPMAEFIVSQSTMSDSSIYHFVPGIGITQYQYFHHGTLSEVDIKLMEYHPGK